MKKTIAFTLCCFIGSIAHAQNPSKKMLGHRELVTWNKIEAPQIADDGEWVTYSLKPEEGDAVLKIYDAKTAGTTSIERGEGAQISSDSRFVVFKIKPHLDSLKAMRRRKVKKDDLPKDTLGIYDLVNQQLVKIPEIKSFKLPEKWAGWLVYQKEIEKPEKDSTKAVVDSTKVSPPDSTALKPKKKVQKKKAKKETKENGTKLVIRELETGKEQVTAFVTDYGLAKEGARILLASTGNDSTFLPGVYLFDCTANELKPLFRQKGNYKNLTFDLQGEQVAFLLNLDTTEARIPPFGLAYWTDGADSARIVADTAAGFLQEDWIISEFGKPQFSKDGSKLYFGIAPPPILQDTSLLEEEIVKVEVWSWTDDFLHTQQKVRLEQDKKKNYPVVFFPEDGKFVQLGSEEMPKIIRGDEGNANVALGLNDQPYRKLISWEGFPGHNDLYVIDLKTGVRKLFAKNVKGSARLSPNAQYAYWFSSPDTAWFAYSIKKDTLVRLTHNDGHPFYNELHDTPQLPSPYGIATWTKGDEKLLIYDRYDLWEIDPQGLEAPVNLTQGRGSRTTYRYIRLDPEERFVEPNARLLLHVFDEKTKASGYGFLHLDAGKPIKLVLEDYAYSRRPKKAKGADKLIFTKENFQTFPDLQYSDFNFAKAKKISDANPQQAAYSWGTIELYEWTSLDGQRLQGMLVKPENFDPKKKYPLLVNFYERSSNGLNRHRAPYPHRSTINYSFYASRGYLIFNPDVPYRIGYPGESAFNAVTSGVAALIDEGFVDKDRIGLQGHSWGGYQVAYLLTKTDMFRCAESGAPVVNMFSAYGGIRWGSGLSRMFQYEQSQSRIGGTIWEYPLRYLENSPIFFTDKVHTPVLILHNDKDTAVPWYQGIEYFVALRRLGKPAWLLNYNDEPHWPLKLQNRKDFNIRMQQFFDHYLKNAPMPKWMERGVPEIEKGILQGLELRE